MASVKQSCKQSTQVQIWADQDETGVMIADDIATICQKANPHAVL
jgi:DNA topoisomerase IA